MYALLAAYLLGGLSLLPLLLALTIAGVYFSAPVYVPSPPCPPSSSHDSTSQSAHDSEDSSLPLLFRSGWLVIRRTYDPVASNDGSYMGMISSGYRSFVDARSRLPVRPRDSFFAVLKKQTLYLYENEEQRDCWAAIELAYLRVVMFPHASRDGELFIKRNAIVAFPDSLQEPVPIPAAVGVTDSLDPDSSLPWFFFTPTNVEKEDWYHALLAASASCPPQPSFSSEALFNPVDMARLILNIDHQPDPIPVRWLNAFLGRIFLAVYRTQALKDHLINRMMSKLERVRKPYFLSDIRVRDVDVGSITPFFSRPMLKDLSPKGDASVEVDVSYTSGDLRITIEAVVTINLGTRFRSYRVPVLLAVVLKSLKGTLLLKLKRPPSNRIWFGFTSMPDMQLYVEPVVSTRQIKWSMIVKAIESQLRQIIAESVVVPHLDDIVFFDSASLDTRGGIWPEALRHLDEAPSDEFNDALSKLPTDQKQKAKPEPVEDINTSSSSVYENKPPTENSTKSLRKRRNDTTKKTTTATTTDGVRNEEEEFDKNSSDDAALSSFISANVDDNNSGNNNVVQTSATTTATQPSSSRSSSSSSAILKQVDLQAPTPPLPDESENFDAASKDEVQSSASTLSSAPETGASAIAKVREALEAGKNNNYQSTPSSSVTQSSPPMTTTLESSPSASVSPETNLDADVSPIKGRDERTKRRSGSMSQSEGIKAAAPLGNKPSRSTTVSSSSPAPSDKPPLPPRPSSLTKPTTTTPTSENVLRNIDNDEELPPLEEIATTTATSSQPTQTMTGMIDTLRSRAAATDKQAIAAGVSQARATVKRWGANWAAFKNAPSNSNAVLNDTVITSSANNSPNRSTELVSSRPTSSSSTQEQNIKSTPPPFGSVVVDSDLLPSMPRAAHHPEPPSELARQRRRASFVSSSSTTDKNESTPNDQKNYSINNNVVLQPSPSAPLTSVTIPDSASAIVHHNTSNSLTSTPPKQNDPLSSSVEPPPSLSSSTVNTSQNNRRVSTPPSMTSHLDINNSSTAPPLPARPAPHTTTAAEASSSSVISTTTRASSPEYKPPPKMSIPDLSSQPSRHLSISSEDAQSLPSKNENDTTVTSPRLPKRPNTSGRQTN